MFAIMCWANLLSGKQVGACQQTGSCVLGDVPTPSVFGDVPTSSVFGDVPTPSGIGQLRV
jgi:hypothetical protein